MSDKVSVTVRMEEERRDKWDEWVEEHPTIRARSVLIRRSVNKFMDEDPLHPNNENKKRKKIHNELQSLMDSAERMNDTLNEQVEKLDEIKEKQLTRSEMEELAEMTAEKIIEKRMRA